jgi:hypothetical protein
MASGAPITTRGKSTGASAASSIVDAWAPACLRMAADRGPGHARGVRLSDRARTLRCRARKGVGRRAQNSDSPGQADLQEAYGRPNKHDDSSRSGWRCEGEKIAHRAAGVTERAGELIG